METEPQPENEFEEWFSKEFGIRSGWVKQIIEFGSGDLREYWIRRINTAIDEYVSRTDLINRKDDSNRDRNETH